MEDKNYVDDVLAVTSRPEKRGPRIRGKSRSKSKNSRKTTKCYYCHEKDTLNIIVLRKIGNFKRKEMLKSQLPYVSVIMTVQMHC